MYIKKTYRLCTYTTTKTTTTKKKKKKKKKRYLVRINTQFGVPSKITHNKTQV